MWHSSFKVSGVGKIDWSINAQNETTRDRDSIAILVEVTENSGVGYIYEPDNGRDNNGSKDNIWSVSEQGH